MDDKKIIFRKAKKTDKKLIEEWFDEPHVKEFWDKGKKIWENCESYLDGQKERLDYWICSYESKSFGLIMTSDAAEPDPRQTQTPDYFIPWIEPDGITLTLDFIIGERDFLGKGLASLTLKKFTEVQDPSIKALLVDPEVKNGRAIHIYEKVGFVRVSTFTTGEGFFKGKPHYLMKLKILPR
jgi:RimJ/RimL family protein N-acetyltransferase